MIQFVEGSLDVGLDSVDTAVGEEAVAPEIKFQMHSVVKRGHTLIEITKPPSNILCLHNSNIPPAVPLKRLTLIVLVDPSSWGDAVPVAKHGVPYKDVSDMREALFDSGHRSFESAGELHGIGFKFVVFSTDLGRLSALLGVS